MVNSCGVFDPSLIALGAGVVLLWLVFSALRSLFLESLDLLSSTEHRKFYILMFAISLLGAIILLHPMQAREGFGVTDSWEYAAAAKNFVETGNYKLVLGDNEYAPRYLPWFPLSVLAPVYALGAPLEFGRLAVNIFALVAIIIALLLGSKGGLLGATASALLLVVLPDLRYFGNEAMTDVPAAVLFLLGIFYPFNAKEPRLRDSFLASVLLSTAASFRPLMLFGYLALLLRFFYSGFGRKFSSHLLSVMAPIVILIFSTMFYQYQVFGSPIKTGYQYWLQATMTTPVLSTQYLSTNLVVMLNNTNLVVCGLVFLAVLIYRRAKFTRSVEARLEEHRLLADLIPAFAAVIPIALVHLIYFYSRSRFLLPLEILTCVLTGRAVSSLLPRSYKFEQGILIVVFLLAGLVGIYNFTRILTPSKPELLRSAIENLPAEDFLLVSGANPLIIEDALRSSPRRISLELLPISREVEYASKKVVANAGGTPAEVYSFTALENPEIIKNALEKGINVLLDSTSLNEAEQKTMNEDWRFIYYQGHGSILRRFQLP